MPVGIYVRTKNTRQILSECHKGICHSKATKEKLAKLRTGYKCSDVTIKKMSKAQKIAQLGNTSRVGTINSEDTNRKISESQSKRMEKALLEGTVKWCNTDIEMLMYEGLLSRGYIIEKQKYIKGVVRVDFYLLEHNLIIECDGDYWHKKQGRQERDRIRTEKMKIMGYKVLRFFGSEIKQNLEQCLNKIKEVTNEKN